MEEDNKRKIDYWSIVFSIISIIFGNLTLFIQGQNQKYIMIIFTISSILLAVVFYYINKTNNNEEIINRLKDKLEKNIQEIKEKINYIKELYELKMRVDMLEKRKSNKKGNFNLLDIIKIIVAIILIYVIVQVVKSL
ncbi:MAG: hypothetical protein AABX10_00975 [Nanoarchaeota archaeon]